jgi:uncharacterized membrane protein YkoI
MRNWIAGLGVAFTAAAAGSALAEDVVPSDVPEGVRKTIEEEAKGATIEDVEREQKADGKTYYEVELERDDQEWTLHIDEKGKVLERRRDK